MNIKQTAMILQMAAAKATQKAVFTTTVRYGSLTLNAGDSIAVIGRTSSYIHPSRQGFVAVTPSGREIVIFDETISCGYATIEPRS